MSDIIPTANTSLSRIERKLDTTNRAAREIIDHELNARLAKTKKLKEARLAAQAAGE